MNMRAWLLGHGGCHPAILFSPLLLPPQAIVTSATRPAAAMVALAPRVAAPAAAYAAQAPVVARAPVAAPAYMQPAHVPAARMDPAQALEQARRMAAAQPAQPVQQRPAAWQPQPQPQPAPMARPEPAVPAVYSAPAGKKQKGPAAYPAPIPAAVAAAAAADGADEMVELEGEQDQAAVSWG